MLRTVYLRRALHSVRLITRDPWLIRHVRGPASLGELQRLGQPWLRAIPLATVLDIGANSGQFSSAARVVWPRAEVWAFEPLSDVFAGLQARLGTDPHVHAIQVAVSDRGGEDNFHRSQFDPSSSLLPMAALHREAFPWTAKESTTRVAVERLDALVPDVLERPLLMKIDVQGTEDRVIRGGRRTLDQTDVLIVEASVRPLYEGQPLFDEIYSILRGIGFEYRGNIGQLLHPSTSEVLQVDAVFTKPETYHFDNAKYQNNR